MAFKRVIKYHLVIERLTQEIPQQQFSQVSTCVRCWKWQRSSGKLLRAPAVHRALTQCARPRALHKQDSLPKDMAYISVSQSLAEGI